MNGTVSPLRRILVEIHRGGSLEDVAARIGVAPDEAAAMVDYWVGRGVLTREAVSGGCPPAGCGGCTLRASCTSPGLTRKPSGPPGTSPGLTGRPLLHTIRPADAPGP
ncbi:hypothetical protein H9Y04_39990 [Streptomyces sp. TRM66268-LWL]|uniref:Transcriptional regulator HTH-type FeoC domain-containing protein n=1 Tax=Streptomyces polyasparticus TaxID=2767826 RepID=A0ABR7STC4_9ACTN|nr:FeoC-like transcriptional regulator [Streptomyces polyasparticus]MBC9718726.1 hypothetical protein [Streptomyces polyasparticus]